MTFFDHPDFDDHEKIIILSDRSSGLRGFIAIHSTIDGRSVGGTRIWYYDKDEEALQDVLRLSRGMSYKTALAETAIGGAKAVLMKPAPDQDVTEAMLRAYARQVEKLQGEFLTAKDVGCADYHLEIMHQECRFIASVQSEHKTNSSGNSGPPTAYGNLMAILAVAKHKFKRDDLGGLKISVQGLGNVGLRLCELLHKHGVELFVSDINQDLVAKAVKEYRAHPIEGDAIYGLDVDVFAPCAMGAILNAGNISRLRAKSVAGSANNQLATPEDATRLHDKGILYAPDYIVNSGGLINGRAEIFNQPYDREAAFVELEKIRDTLLDVFVRAEAENISPASAADQMAEQRFRP